jgi:hypothetical protein
MKPALDWVALRLAVAVGASLLTLGLLVVNGRAAPQAGSPGRDLLLYGSVALFAAAADVCMLVLGGISGRPRLIRHLWGMCFRCSSPPGASSSGQQPVFPEPIRKQYLLPSLAVLPFSNDLLAFAGLIRKAMTRGYLPRS